MARCPTCGHEIAELRDERWLLDILTNGHPHRKLYLGQNGNWYVTYGGVGPVDRGLVRRLVDRGAVQSVYSSIPNQAYHVGKTIDCERTLEARRRHGRKAGTIYISTWDSNGHG